MDKKNFDKPLHVGVPNVLGVDEVFAHFRHIFEEKWLTNNGEYVRTFELELAEYLGVRHCILVCNATTALQIVIRALDLSGEVIVPSFTFIATPHALAWLGLTPVFCDIDKDRMTLDVDYVAEAITPRTSGILGVHTWGRACDVTALQSIADKYGLSLFYDAAHALGCSYKGSMIGGFGDAEVFSLHATKSINACEGGVITTNNDALAEKMRLMIKFGFSGYDNVIDLGINGKLSELHAAMGLVQFRHRDEIFACNKLNYETYRREIGGKCKGLSLIEYDTAESQNYQYLVAQVEGSDGMIVRDAIVDALQKENVLARKYFYPGCHRSSYYKKIFCGANLPNTEEISERVIVLPTGMQVSEQDIVAICDIIVRVLQQCERTFVC